MDAITSTILFVCLTTPAVYFSWRCFKIKALAKDLRNSLEDMTRQVIHWKTKYSKECLINHADPTFDAEQMLKELRSKRKEKILEKGKPFINDLVDLKLID